MRLRLLITLLVAAVAAQAGVTLSLTLDDSTIYPGTTREVTVTVPDAYTGDTPAALCVGLDGALCNAPAVIDSLTRAGVMPVTIGVWLQAGRVIAADGTVLRYNRSNEFDAIDDTFARFLELEVLPAVQALTTPDGRAVRLTADPDNRMIMGLSSGGIGAFVAAWQRTDLFRRVYSGVGTFVAMRGGNDVQALVRKTEPMPLRVVLQDGTNDAWNPLFGHWYEGNRMLATALDFAGVAARYDWSDGGHNVVRSTRVLPEALTWLWSEKPDRGTTGNDLLQEMLIAGETWHATTPPHHKPSTTALYPDSTLRVYHRAGDNNLWQETRVADGTYANAQRFYRLHSPSGDAVRVTDMAFESRGNLLVATDAGLQVCDQNGRVRAILRYPAGIDIADALIVEDGALVIVAAGQAWRRNINVTPPHSRPRSQGQG